MGAFSVTCSPSPRVHQLSNPCADPRKLTQSVLQVTEMLGMYQAELARVLQLQCGDIGRLANGRRVLERGTVAWGEAVLFIRLYEALYEKLGGDGVAMCNWLRRDNEQIGGVPLLLIVDEGRLRRTLDYVQNHLQV